MAFGQAFTFTIGSPVASQDSRSKMAAFVFRVEGCAEPASAQVGGTAEGLVHGARTSVALKLMPMSRPGVYAVFPTWPAEGDWVVNLNGTCARERAGALIPIGPGGFIRGSSKFLPRPATAPESRDRPANPFTRTTPMETQRASWLRPGPALVLSAAVWAVAADRPALQPSDLTVHEWGTFTSVAGKDGSAIEWDTLGCKDDLPGFVQRFRISWLEVEAERHGADGDAGDLFLQSARRRGGRADLVPARVDHRMVSASQVRRVSERSQWRTAPAVEKPLRDRHVTTRVTGAIEWSQMDVHPNTAPPLADRKRPESLLRRAAKRIQRR
jgi:hypothetical protein